MKSPAQHAERLLTQRPRRAIFGLHGDEPDGHALVGSRPTYNAAGANLPFGGVEEQLDVTAWRERFRDPDEHAAQGKIFNARDESVACGGPSEERALRRSHPGVTAKIVLLRHSGNPGREWYSLLKVLEEKIEVFGRPEASQDPGARGAEVVDVDRGGP